MFNLFDSQSGGISLLFIGFCEAAVIGWGVGEFLIIILYIVSGCMLSIGNCRQVR